MQDYKSSVMLDYSLNETFLNLASDRTRMHSYLAAVFDQIVAPMSKSLRRVMVQFCFASEAELFTSDMHFKMFSSAEYNQYKCRDGPTKHEDAMENLRS